MLVSSDVSLNWLENDVEKLSEHDPLFPDDILEEGRKQFAASSVEHEIKTYPEVPHGK